MTPTGVPGRTRRGTEWLRFKACLVPAPNATGGSRALPFSILAEEKSYFRSLRILLLEGVTWCLA